MSAIRYRAEIDGLRAVAVIPVILFHMGLPWLRGGFLGVDVFFVISGFLITSIIASEREAGTFSFAKFWERRFRRIVPVLSVVTLATSLASYCLVFPGELNSTGSHGLSALLSCANFYSWKHTGDYWGSRAESQPFLHMWSLSVEEQFYLFYPAILLIALWSGKWATRAVFAAAIAGSLLLFLVGAASRPTATFYLLPTRIWELGIGGAVALLPRQLAEARRHDGWRLGGVGLIILSYLIGGTRSEVSPAYIVPVLGAALAIFPRSSGPVTRLLSAKPVVWIGKLSYSLYLWHWPVIVLSHAAKIPAAIQIPLMVGLSLFSYFLIEIRARQPGSRLIPTVFLLACAATSCVALWDVDFQYDVSEFGRQQFLGRVYAANPRLDAGDWDRVLVSVDAPMRPDDPNLFSRGGVIKKYGGATPEIVLLGDSHATMHAGVVDQIAASLGRTVSFYAMNGVDPFLGAKSERSASQLAEAEMTLYDAKRVEFLKAWRPKVVIIASWWGSKTLENVTPLFRLLDECADHIVIVEQPPVLTCGNANVVQYLRHLGVHPVPGRSYYLPQGEQLRHQAGCRLIREIADAHPKCRVVPIASRLLGPDGDVRVLDGQEAVYLDDDHLTQYGAELSAADLRSAIEAAIRPE